MCKPAIRGIQQELLVNLEVDREFGVDTLLQHCVLQDHAADRLAAAAL